MMSKPTTTTEMPLEMLDLPVPWCVVAREEYESEIAHHIRSDANLLRAIDVISRALKAERQGHWDDHFEISEEVPWGLVLHGVDRQIGRIDNYRRNFFVRIFEFGAGRRGTRDEVDRLAAVWLSGTIDDVFRRALDWLLPSLREDAKSTVAQAYRKLVSDAWKHIDEIKASSLISYLALVRCPETEELLQEIDNDPDVTPDLKHAVMGVRSNWKEQDYYKANPHLLKW